MHEGQIINPKSSVSQRDRDDSIRYGKALGILERDLHSNYIEIVDCQSLARSEAESDELITFLKENISGVCLPYLEPFYFSHGKLLFNKMIRIDGITKHRKKDLISILKKHPEIEEADDCAKTLGYSIDKWIEDNLSFF